MPPPMFAPKLVSTCVPSVSRYRPPPAVKYGSTPKIGTGGCSSTFPIPVLRDGAAADGSSVVAAYSNSKPMTSRPPPAATPRTRRFAGVVVAPMKPVTSAAAGLAASAIETAATTQQHIRIRPPLMSSQSHADTDDGFDSILGE